MHIEDDCPKKTHLYISLKHKDQPLHYGIPVLHGQIHDGQTNYGVSGLEDLVCIFFKNEWIEPVTLRDLATCSQWYNSSFKEKVKIVGSF